MYGTGAPVGAAGVVVPYCEPAGDVSVGVGVVSVDVEDESVGAVVVVAPEDVGVVSVGDDDELLVDAGVVSVSVLIVIGDTSPSAPEASRPSAKSAASPTETLIRNFRTFSTSRLMRVMPLSPDKTARASPDRSNANDGVRPRRSGQARTDQLSAVVPLPSRRVGTWPIGLTSPDQSVHVPQSMCRPSARS